MAPPLLGYMRYSSASRTAAILRHATPRSLIIMDEIGRGTTLSSGLAIAYATLLHILGTTRCRTLFATHYHELADMLRVDGIDRHGVEYWCTDVEEMVSSAACRAVDIGH